ncbi:pentatricopeptide repeat-containing protein [Carex littledalei]|uniref:Pentatricopeptide repeat-containing protein n=1 Tax=Carex littledalei TaxID=544730 RepID=A0A833QPF5_9POAL|nr:pentatricopeptide repeat-containing protein [Carex littledalei]
MVADANFKVRNATTGTHFSSFLLTKSFSFGRGLNNIRVTVSGLANGEVKVGSREISSIEQELNFSPTFSDYVKFMESVKLDRSNIVDGNFYDNKSSKKTKKQTNLKKPSFKTNDDNYKEKVRPAAIKGKHGGWSQVESILPDKKSNNRDKFENEKSKSNSNEKYKRKSDSFGKIGGTIGESVTNKSAMEKFAGQKAYDNDQQERLYQEKETKMGNSGTVAMREISKEKYSRVVRREHEKYKSDFFGKIGGTIGQSVRNNNSKEKFAQQKTCDNGQQERFYQEKEKLGNEKPTFISNEKYKRKSDSFGKIGGTIGESVTNKSATEKFAGQKAYDNGQQERLYQEKETKMGNSGTVAMREISKEKYSRVVRREHEKYKSDFSGKIGGTIGQRVRNNNSKEKFAQQKTYDNGQQERFYQEKETKLGNFGIPAMHEKSKEKYGGVVRREHYAVKNGKDNSVIEPMGSQKYNKLEGGYEIGRVGQRSYKKTDAKFERYGAVDMQEKAKQQRDIVLRKEISGKDIDERAAFKTFEVFTDIRNRPRVLRMEMEERIKKLAISLNASDVNIPEWKFSKLMHGAKIRFSDHTILRVVQFLGDYGNWKRALQVVQWLKSRERFKSLKSRYIYTTVLDVLGKAKRPFEALNVFHSMREELASYPDLAAYHCIAVTLGRAGLMKELFDVIDCMRTLPEKKFNLGPLQKWDPRLEPDLVVYNAVLNACVQQKQWEGAFWVLQQLDQKGIRPTSTTYGLVMEVMLACGKYNLVYEFYNKVKRSYIPSALNYKVLLNALWREGKTEEAVLAVKDMEQHGVVGTASLYYDLARCLCTAGRCEEALLQIDKICKVAKKPLVVTYTGLIQTCIDSNNIENARYIFNQMQNFCAPNLITYNIMLKSYKQEKMFDDAKGLFNEIINGKVVPDKFTFNTMMEVCVENGKFEDFERVFLQMLRHGHHFDARKHLKMVMDAFKAGKDGVLEATWQHLVYFGRVPPVPLIMERFYLKLKQGHIPSAVSCITNFEESGLQNISPKSWYNLLLNNSNHLEEKHVAKLIEEINCLVGSSKHKIVYENILSGCKRFLSDSR